MQDLDLGGNGAEKRTGKREQVKRRLKPEGPCACLVIPDACGPTGVYLEEDFAPRFGWDSIAELGLTV